jgi:ketosteroid isomerase-like protein
LIKKILFGGLFVCMTLVSFPTFAEEPDHAIHEELRAVVQTLESAINAGDFDKMLPILSEQVRATPINQEFLAGRAEVSAYFKKWFGTNGYLKKLEISLAPDALTELSADKSWGLVRGSGVEKYILRDGRPYELHTRWTATMVKEDDGHWRIRGIHIGTNFLDNPILSEAAHALGKAAAGGLAGGLLAGGIAGWLIGRRKKIS